MLLLVLFRSHKYVILIQVLFTKEGSFVLPPRTIAPNLYKHKTVFQARRKGNLYVYNIGGRPEPMNRKGDFIVSSVNSSIPKKNSDTRLSASQSARTDLENQRKNNNNNNNNSSHQLQV